ncbi:MAG: nuclear transport factor 2 family protein [Actinomycetota bacterium]|nr:nuclear transport factor 2 family protein [Actinomycetota bacterium]
MAREAENVAVVRAVYDAFNREGWDAMLEYAHPDIEPSIPLPKRRGGR